jgi:hypothetical protein
VIALCIIIVVDICDAQYLMSAAKVNEDDNTETVFSFTAFSVDASRSFVCLSQYIITDYTEPIDISV